MKTTILASLVILSCATAFGQDPNTGVTVTVSSSMNLTPSDVSFQFGLASGTSTTLDDVIAALQDLGVTAQNLSGLNTFPSGPPGSAMRVSYSFTVTVPFAKFKDFSDKLDKLRRTLPDTLEFQGHGANILPSTAALDDARAHIVPDLIASARQKAQAFAAAAQIKIGPVLSVIEGSSFSPSPNFVPCCFYGPPSQLGASVALTVRFGVQ